MRIYKGIFRHECASLSLRGIIVGDRAFRLEVGTDLGQSGCINYPKEPIYTLLAPEYVLNLVEDEQ